MPMIVAVAVPTLMLFVHDTLKSTSRTSVLPSRVTSTSGSMREPVHVCSGISETIALEISPMTTPGFCCAV